MKLMKIKVKQPVFETFLCWHQKAVQANRKTSLFGGLGATSALWWSLRVLAWGGRIRYSGLSSPSASPFHGLLHSALMLLWR